MLLLLLACATEPTPAPPAAPLDPVVAQVDKSLQAGQAQVPWLQGGAGAAPAMPPMSGMPGMDAAQQPASPREQADLLFNDAMRAHETGDAAAAAELLPQALQAYAVVPGLDLDGYFHVSVLQLAAGRAEDARTTADLVLLRRPTHLLALGAAARAAEQQGDTAGAAAYHQRYREAFPAEQGALPEYEHHQALLPVYLREAGG